MEYYIWSIAGVVLTIIFAIMSGIFLFYKEKACTLISGYNFKTKEEREQYDEKQISKHYRNMFFYWAVIFFIGAIFANYLERMSFGVACLMWLLSFCKNVHVDEEKEFEKYKKR